MSSRRSLGAFRPWRRVRTVRADLRVARAGAEQVVPIADEFRARLEECQLGLGALHSAIAALDGEIRGPSQHTGSIAALEQRIGALEALLTSEREERRAQHERTMLGLRIVRDDDQRSWGRLWQLRSSDEYELAYTEPEPLVTIIIPTYVNWELMRDRAIPSVLAQTYENWECLIVGDAAPREAAEVVNGFDDPRLRFVNLSHRGPYPETGEDAWLISGTFPFNAGLGLRRGRWFGAVADDDALAPRFVESMLALARAERAEVAYGRLRQHGPDGGERIFAAFPPAQAQWGVQGALFHGALGFLPLLPSDWVFSVPNDWSWAERMLRIGVRFAMSDEVTAEYFPSQLWADRPTRG